MVLVVERGNLGVGGKFSWSQIADFGRFGHRTCDQFTTLLPVLICPPELMDDDQKSFEEGEKPILRDVVDAYAFGSLMYQVLTGEILDENKPFDQNLLDTKLPGDDNMFMRELIRVILDKDPSERPCVPFMSHVATFVTILQKKVDYVKFISYCRACITNGDTEAEKYCEGRQNTIKPSKPPLIHGTRKRDGKYSRPVAVSFLMGKKVIHNPTVFAQKISEAEPGKKIIFINVFGGYQKGKSTTLYLLSGNTKYVLGNGTYETTRGVSVDGPYLLNEISNVFTNIPGIGDSLNQQHKIAWDENLIKENPNVFLVDIEGYDGNINGYDQETNKRIYQELARPYLSLATSVMLLVDKHEGNAARTFAVENLKMQNFADRKSMDLRKLMLIIRNVDRYSYCGSMYEYNDPFKETQYENACVQFKNQFGGNFAQKGIDVKYCPLGPWDHRHQAVEGNEMSVFDKSFIVMVRVLLNQIHLMNGKGTCTEGAINTFIGEVNAMTKIQSEEEDKKGIRERNDKAHRLWINSRFTKVRDTTVDHLKEIITIKCQDYNDNIESFDPVVFDKESTKWLEHFNILYDENANQDSLAVQQDLYGYRDDLRHSGKIILMDLLTEIRGKLTEKLIEKHTNDMKTDIMKHAPPLIDRVAKDIEHNLYTDHGWDYYVAHHKTLTHFIGEWFNKATSEHDLLTESGLLNAPPEVKKWGSLYLASLRESFAERVQQAFNHARVHLAKTKPAKISQVGSDQKIPGQKGYVKRTVKQEWEAPDGTSIVEVQEVTWLDGGGRCLLL